MFNGKFDKNNYDALEKSYPDNVKKNIAFIILTPDTIQRDIYLEVINYFRVKHNARILAAKVKYLKDYEIEQLYRYSFRKKIIEDDMTFWWLIERTYKEFPCLALILYSTQYEESSFCETVLKYKGSFAVKCAPVDHTIRDMFGCIGRVLAVLHSSDDLEALFRESLLFFSEDEFKTAILNKEYALSTDLLTDLFNPLQDYDYNEFCSTLFRRITAGIKIYYPNINIDIEFWKSSFAVKSGDPNFQKNIKSIYQNTNDSRLKFFCEIILILMYDLEVDWSKNFKEELRSCNIPFNDWDEVLFMNYLLFKEV